jgi:hypothetical protein
MNETGGEDGGGASEKNMYLIVTSWCDVIIIKYSSNRAFVGKRLLKTFREMPTNLTVHL